MVEVVQLEQQFDVIYGYMLALDFSMALSAGTIGFIVGASLFVKYVIN